jgi:chemotaxis protein MotB
MRSSELYALAALLPLAACISKEQFLKKVDEAARFRNQYESCQRTIEATEKARRVLEGDIRDLQEQVARTGLERDKCRSDLVASQTKVEGEAGVVRELREALKKTNDEVNELRAKIAIAGEQVRGSENKVALAQREARRLVAEAKRPADLSDVLAAIKPAVETESLIRVQPLKGAVLVRIPHNLLFLRRPPALSKKGKELVARLADALSPLQGRTFLVQGHEEGARSAGRYRNPVDLSLAEATAVGAWLLKSGIEPARISLAGLGDTRPLITGEGAEARFQSRRIEIVITAMSALEPVEVIGPGAPRPENKERQP